MTLERRLSFSLIGITLLALLLLGFSTNYMIQNKFNSYVATYQEQRLNHWEQLLSNYYIENNSWQGIQALVAPHGMGMKGRGVGNRRTDFVTTENSERIILTATDGSILVDSRYNEALPFTYSAETPHREIIIDGKDIGTVWLDPQPLPGIQSMEEQFSRSVMLVFFGAGLFILVIAIVLARLLAQKLIHPLHQLMGAIQQIADGNKDSRVSIQSNDELGALAEQFNHMIEEIQQTELQQKNMIANVAHDLRTPIAILRGNLESMLAGIIPTNEEKLATLYDEVHRMSYLVQELHDLSLAEARQLQLNREWIDIVPFLQSIQQVFLPEAEQKNIQLLIQQPTDPSSRLFVDPRRLEQVLYNLMANALRHTPAGGTIQLRWEKVNENVKIEILDSGSGIDPDDLPHLFERFYRGDKARNRASGGSGLGLAIVKELVQLHSGHVEAANRPEGGSHFTIILPIETSTE
ncbi:sensor histidine kinase [Rubeoparvulum massiliense]|uniref:sensor histidine kinase n=1 Tax=Rubeoparvulum massiliense TaxID=1631346 RepID=UPI00065E4863|nr:ATP-binding protein [Rubeoparvulum massiliense]